MFAFDFLKNLILSFKFFYIFIYSKEQFRELKLLMEFLKALIYFTITY